MDFIWGDYEDGVVTDYVFDTNLSTREIAVEMAATDIEIKQRIRELGLSWVRRRNGHMSRGQAALTQIMRKLLPGEKVVTEEPVGERLLLDVYCPGFKLAAEYHGRQHFLYVEYFHKDKQGFLDSQKRDERKQELCDQLGITLVVFRYNDVLDEDMVFDRLVAALREPPRSGQAAPPTNIEIWKQKQKDYRKQAYRDAKRMKQNRNQ